MGRTEVGGIVATSVVFDKGEATSGKEGGGVVTGAEGEADLEPADDCDGCGGGVDASCCSNDNDCCLDSPANEGTTGDVGTEIVFAEASLICEVIQFSGVLTVHIL